MTRLRPHSILFGLCIFFRYIIKYKADCVYLLIPLKRSANNRSANLQYEGKKMYKKKKKNK